MKTTLIRVALFGFIATILFSQCKKEDIAPLDTIDDNDTLSTDSEPYKGSIGIVIDARAIARKGYNPQTAVVNFSEDYNKFSRTIPLGEDTYFGVLKFEVDSLTTSEFDGFSEGVPVEIIILDSQQREVGGYEADEQVLDAQNRTLFVDTELPQILPALKLNSKTPYLIQSEDSKKLVTSKPINSIGFPPYPRGLFAEDYDYTSEYQKFNFVPVPEEGDSVYYILSMDGFFLYGTPDAVLIQSPYKYGIDEPSSGYPFVIKADKPGWIKLRLLYASKPVKENTEGNSQGHFYSTGSEDDYTSFRLINADLQWTVIDMGTSYSQPILPQAKLEFAYKATLSNCSGATLTETIGRSETRTQSFTSGTEESLELFSSHEASVEVTAGVEVDAKFFGKGATYNLEVSAGYTYTTSTTNTSTKYWESTKTTEVEISREREVEIGPYLAVEAYDAVETLSNVKLPFTKKFRISAQDSKGNPISGDELVFELFSNQFNGVVSATADNFIEITIRGNTVIDKMMEVDTKITEIDDACN